MKYVTIRRCPTCPTIGSHADQLAAELQNSSNLKVNVVDGAKGEFGVAVDGREVNAKDGESLRSPTEVAAEIRGTEAATAG